MLTKNLEVNNSKKVGMGTFFNIVFPLSIFTETRFDSTQVYTASVLLCVKLLFKTNTTQK